MDATNTAIYILQNEGFPSWASGGKQVDCRIRQVSVCPRTPPRRMLQWPFHYNDSLMYVAVGDINSKYSGKHGSGKK